MAEYLGVSTRTVQTYANEPDPELRLNGVLLGNRWRFEEKDVVIDLKDRTKILGRECDFIDILAPALTHIMAVA